MSSAAMVKQVKTHPNHTGLGAYNISFLNALNFAANDAAVRAGPSNNCSIVLLNGISQGSGQHQRSPSSTLVRMRSLYLKGGILPMFNALASSATTEVQMHSYLTPTFLQVMVVYDKRPTTPASFPSFTDLYETATDPMSHTPPNSRQRFDILYRKTISFRGDGWFSEANFATAWGTRPRTMITSPYSTPLLDVRIPINRDAVYIASPTPSADTQAVTELVSGHLYLVTVGGLGFISGSNIRFYAYPRLSFVDV